MVTFHSSRCVPVCGKSSVVSSHLLFTPIGGSNSGLQSGSNSGLQSGSNSGLQSGSTHCLVDPFLISLVDRFHSVPVPV
ncbi:unnamed protein product [Protopolystoma xenopodis]|uniref:Uncharacterized protein n=1 Tax=Protopolystoma xenopodis TaxID=117903 RepID=A0A3S5ARY6_9PLAT|nr:unnamed protein product [Protopolystoma xenopodis]